MPKGKKFSAAEKHFMKKEQRLNRQIKSLYLANESLRQENFDFAEQLRLAQSKIVSLQDWVDQLLEYTKLSKEDIRAVCEKDKDLNMAVSAINYMLGMMGGRR